MCPRALLLPAVTFLIAIVATGACSSDSKPSAPPPTPVPAGVTFAGGLTSGGPCSGDDYVAATAGVGFLVCVDGTWEYSEDNPDNACGFGCLDTVDSNEDASVEQDADGSTSESADADASSSSG